MSTPPVRRVAETDTVLSVFRSTVAARPGAVAVRAHDGSTSLTWDELDRAASGLAAGFAALGVRAGDTIALLLRNRPEFYPVDLAAITLGAVTVSLYPTTAPEQLRHVLLDSGASVVISERGLAGAPDGMDLPALRFLVDGGLDDHDGWRPLREIAEAGDPAGPAPEAPRPDDVLTMIYTSGTTGAPKGVRITHRAVLATAVATNSELGLPPGTTVISWLPAAHVGDRLGGYYIPMLTGWEIVTCADPRVVLDVVAHARPGYFFGPPRVFEKLRSDFATWRDGLDVTARKHLDTGLEAAYAQVRACQAGITVPDDVADASAEFREIGVRDWKRAVGLDRLLVALVATAPNPGPVMEFFHAVGVPLGEAYGLTESTGAGTTVGPATIRIGKVGTASLGMELRIGDGGEVLLRGPQIMAGYHHRRDATAAAIDPDGWLHTGDLGELDDDGYLSILGRAKELIINAQGKNISPVAVEAAVGTASPLIGHVCVVGDARAYLSALIVLDRVQVTGWAARNGVAEADAVGDPRLRAEVSAAVEAGNARLARPERVRRFHLCDTEWLPGGDELTPTSKLRRHRIAELYADEIDALYSDALEERS
ncbi:MAG: AMP-dependent synthetase/ligase [Pseudonocardia sp.]|nr:AMP-dependent synthetase/ligase [Pseudonocardia sp.]